MLRSSGCPGRIGSFAVLFALASCGAAESGRSEATPDTPPGIEVHRYEAGAHVPGPGAGSPTTVTLIHVDPERYELVLLTEARDGRARTVEEWAQDQGLLGAINASMYLPNQRSTGYMTDGEHRNNTAVNPHFGGFLVFGPRREGIPAVRLVGTDCEGFDLDSLRADYRTLVQNYRLLDCDGRPIPWEDRKLYSSAALGLDRRGWVVFVHSGGPVRMSEFARWLAQPEWGLVAANFVEGGPDASLFVEAGAARVREVGSYEGGFGSGSFRPLPNVLGFRKRTSR